MKCTLWTETLKFWRLKVPNSRFALHVYGPFFRPFLMGQRLRGRGQNVSREFGRGKNVLQSVLSKTTFGGLRNWGWSGRRLFLLREMTESRQKRGGKTYRRWGGPKTFLGRGFSPNLRYVFHPPEFSTPLGHSLTWHLSRQPAIGQPLTSRFALHGLRAFKQILSVPF